MPAIRKRQLTLSGASIESDAPQPIKRARSTESTLDLWTTTWGVSTVSDPEAENKELKKLIGDAFAFIENKKLVSKTPASIKKVMFARPDGVGLEM
jgi:hypothetical protein